MNPWLNLRFTPDDESKSVAGGGVHKAKEPLSNAKPKDVIIRKNLKLNAAEIVAFQKYGTANCLARGAI